MTINKHILEKELQSSELQIRNEIKSLSSKVEKILIFDTFPNDDVLNSLPLNSIFEVKGFYTVGDMPKCSYQKVEYADNSIQKGDYYIKPITDHPSILFLPHIGIRSGEQYGVQNSQILARTSLKFGGILKLPIGDYYFDRPIDLKSQQLSLIGEAMSFTPDVNAKGITILVFNNLKEGEKAITIGTGMMSNVTVRGNKTHYNYVIDRNQTYVNKNKIEKETFTRKCYGISGGSITNISNVHVEHFYYGCSLDTGNIYIDNFFARSCHIGLSIGGDTKCKGIYGWDVHTLLHMNRSISSAVQVRADSCHHLVQITEYPSGIYLADLDGDYCLGSIVKIGERNQWSSVEHLTINGVVGRGCCYNAYDSASDPVPNSSNVTKEDVSHWGFISIEDQTKLDGAIITTTSDVSSNPHDSSSTYKTPPILIASAGTCYATINTTFASTYGADGEIRLNRNSLLNSIAMLSDTGNSTRIRLNTNSATYYIHKPNPVSILTHKESVEELQ